jgi:hypothetical protein
MNVMSQVTLQSSLSLFELTQQVATVHAVCLLLYRDVCLPVLSRQQSAGRCTSCAKRPCGQVPPCLSSQRIDNPALCNYAVKYYFKIAASNCLKKTPTKNPSSEVSMQPQNSAEHNCTNSQRNQVRIKTVNCAFIHRHSVPLFSPSRHQKSDPPCSPRDSAQPFRDGQGHLLS